MGSVPNCQKEIPVCHTIRWFKCKLKPPKKHADEGKRFKYTSCTQTCSSQANLRAHVRGAHEGGYTTLCGKKLDWPPKYHRHQRNCKDCENLRIEKRQQKYAIMSKAKHYFFAFYLNCSFETLWTFIKVAF